MSTEKIYCVYVHTCPNGMQYFGISKNVKRRWMPCLYKGCSLEPYIEQFGWKNIEHKVVRENLTRTEALKLEDQLIMSARNNGASVINSYRSGHHSQSLERKEEHNAYTKEYNENHKVERKAYLEANKDKINAYQREYRKRKKAEKQAQQSDTDKVKATKPKHKKPLF